MIQLTALISALFLLTACNNDRLRRLDASYYCREKTDVQLSLNENEEKILEEVSLPEDQRFETLSFSSTVEVVDQFENKIVMSLSGLVANDTPSANIRCTRGVTVESTLQSPVTFEIPYKNGSGDFSVLEIKLSSPEREEGQTRPFAEVSVEIKNPVEEDSVDDPEQTPQSFSSYYVDADQTVVYQLIKSDENNYNLRVEESDHPDGLLNTKTILNIRQVVD